MTPHVLIGALLIGGGIGLVSGLFGKGGSALATPLLHVLGVPAMAALASPLPAAIPSTLYASRPYLGGGHVDRRVLRIGVLIGVPATIIGAACTRFVPGSTLIVAADALVLALGVRVLLSAPDHDSEPATPPALGALRILAIAGAVGLVSGLLGNSGGFLLAPLFVSGLRLPVRRALGTSLLLSTALAVPGTIVHAYLGHIDWALTLVFGLALVPLAGLGASLAMRLRERSLTLAFGASLTALASGLLIFAR